MPKTFRRYSIYSHSYTYVSYIMLQNSFISRKEVEPDHHVSDRHMSWHQLLNSVKRFQIYFIIIENCPVMM